MIKQLVMKFMLQLHKLPKMSAAEMRKRMSALGNQAERTWTSHQLASLNDMKSVEYLAIDTRNVPPTKVTVSLPFAFVFSL